MSPHPVKDIDMDRKEELIMAKQLRAARVTILPRHVNSSYVATKPPKSVLPPTPKPQPRAVAKAANPIALRYWNQCMALSQQTDIDMTLEKEETTKEQHFEPTAPPWVSPDSHLTQNL